MEQRIRKRWTELLDGYKGDTISQSELLDRIYSLYGKGGDDTYPDIYPLSPKMHRLIDMIKAENHAGVAMLIRANPGLVAQAESMGYTIPPSANYINKKYADRVAKEQAYWRKQNGQ